MMKSRICLAAVAAGMMSLAASLSWGTVDFDAGRLDVGELLSEAKANQGLPRLAPVPVAVKKAAAGVGGILAAPDRVDVTLRAENHMVLKETGWHWEVRDGMPARVHVMEWVVDGYDIALTISVDSRLIRKLTAHNPHWPEDEDLNQTYLRLQETLKKAKAEHKNVWVDRVWYGWWFADYIVLDD